MLVYRSAKRDLTVKLTNLPDATPLVELTLGSEVRTFPLAEFTDFWLTMIEVGRREASAYLDSVGSKGLTNGEIV